MPPYDLNRHKNGMNMVVLWRHMPFLDFGSELLKEEIFLKHARDSTMLSLRYQNDQKSNPQSQSCYVLLLQMRGVGRQDIAVLLFVLSCACVYGMKIDFSRLRQLRKPYILEKKSSLAPANSCPPDRPFLCKTAGACIPLEYICNHVRDCPEGFDENPRVCNAKNRPSVEEIEDFLLKNENWIIPKFFDGADPELVAHSLATASDLDDLKLMVGMSENAADNLHEAFEAVLQGDERPLRKLGMPEEEWYDVSYMLDKFRTGGLKV
ncbi:neuropeptide prohormone-4-like [Ylistrum balloti]|uniref:neuropeptide prohormone-4-like n=1 Tax=Ylistrum balloti TaxID=509963 RepID=UPI002905EA70|nr:neuropeptide prohormone-4-like [Ylistrum balloti]